MLAVWSRHTPRTATAHDLVVLVGDTRFPEHLVTRLRELLGISAVSPTTRLRDVCEGARSLGSVGKTMIDGEWVKCPAA